MDNLYNQKVLNTNQLFGDGLLHAKTLYLYHFNMLPSVHYINSIDGEKLFFSIKEKYASEINHEHQYRWYKPDKKKFQFDETLLVLKNNIILEFDDYYCQIFHDGSNLSFIDEIAALALKFRERKKKEPLEINLIVRDRNLYLKSMEIKRTKLDLDLFYEDDFKPVDEVIRQRLNQKKDKGIVLLHGLPGTGKTTYLRYLIGKLKKRVLFLSPNVAGNLMNPEFLDLLIDNPDTVVIIEDAENIIMDRRNSNDSSVSNLLNISDGLLADFLNVQLICTFNSALTMVDSALMRKGRLIAKYEFGKLSVAKAQRLSDHLGFKTKLTKPMTVAEISNQNDMEFETKQVQVIGFRREALIMEN